MERIYRAITALGLAALCALSATALDGSWRGDLKVGMNSLPIVMNFSEKDGATTCTMDSPAQNAYGIPTTVDFVSADSVAVSVATLGASFRGRIASGEIAGTFAQRGFRAPLTLRGELPLLERRPQTPQPPLPYQTIDTAFCSADGTSLRGTLTLPEAYDRNATPMCVLITGSGPQNRDEEIFEHKPFAVIADYLGRNGVASFRYDDRGTGESRGDFASATIDTFKADALAALLFAKGYTDGSAGLIGHSEGGTIALLLAQEGATDFVVSLAGMAVSGKETVLQQNRRAIEPLGFSEDAVAASLTLLDAVFDEIIRQAGTGLDAPIDVDAMAEQLGVKVPPMLLTSIKNNLDTGGDYFGSLLSVDARRGMDRISCPVLALNGSLDVQVAPDENLEAIRSGIKGATAVKLPGLNHLLQPATTGAVSEYSQIRETISPAALALILSFVKER